MKEDRGKLIYKTPGTLFLGNRIRGLLSILGYLAIMLLFIFLLLVFLIDFELLFNNVLFIIGCFSTIILLIMMLIHDLNKEIEDSAEIYQNGYVPYEKRVSQLITREKVFLPFKEIDRVEYHNFGTLIEIYFEDGSMDIINIEWGDIQGYIEFSKAIKQNVKGVSFPNFDAVVNFFRSEDWLKKKKIDKTDFDRLFIHLKNINKDFV